MERDLANTNYIRVNLLVNRSPFTIQTTTKDISNITHVTWAWFYASKGSTVIDWFAQGFS